MLKLSPRQQDQLYVLARLEYAVRKGLPRTVALAKARRGSIPEHLLDKLTQPPGQAGTTMIGGVTTRTVAAASPNPPPNTPTNAFLRDLPFSAELARPRMTLEQAAAVCAQATKALGFPFVLDWASESTRIDIDVNNATHLVVPGAVVRSPGMTPESLGLVLAHERGHRILTTKDEARADYWAARYGARMLWPDASPEELLRKGFLAAYGTLAFISQNGSEPLQLLTDDDPKVTVDLGGYPTLQSRWELFKAGLLGREMPPVVDLRETLETLEA